MAETSDFCLTDADVTAYLATKELQDVIGERSSCLLERAILHKYPGLFIWVNAHEIFIAESTAVAHIMAHKPTRQTAKQHQQMFIHDELARFDQAVTKQSFLDAWSQSWCAEVAEWNTAMESEN